LFFLGLQKTTLIDYPGIVAATVFLPGCNLRCPYCHNPELITGKKTNGMIDAGEFKNFLNKRRNVLGGVCISGGEPTIHENLSEIIDLIHSSGLKVKIDTNGTRPEILRQLEVDFIAMDLKTSSGKYPLLGFGEKKKIIESVNWIKSSGIPHMFRTTIVPEIVTEKDFSDILDMVENSELLSITNFNPKITLDPEFSRIKPYDIDFLEKLKKMAGEKNIRCVIRK